MTKFATAPHTRLTTAELEADIAEALDLYGPYMSARDYQRVMNVGPTTAHKWRTNGIGPKARRMGTGQRVMWEYKTREVITYKARVA